MKDKKRQNRRGKPTGDAPELRVVEINYDPGPDAEDRLRRLFAILLEHAAGESQAVPEDAPADATPGDDAEEEEG